MVAQAGLSHFVFSSFRPETMMGERKTPGEKTKRRKTPVKRRKLIVKCRVSSFRAFLASLRLFVIFAWCFRLFLIFSLGILVFSPGFISVRKDRKKTQIPPSFAIMILSIC